MIQILSSGPRVTITALGPLPLLILSVCDKIESRIDSDLELASLARFEPAWARFLIMAKIGSDAETCATIIFPRCRAVGDVERSGDSFITGHGRVAQYAMLKER